ncbi:MAG: flagellar motor protein [Gemmatimonadaceae bacterium]|nr:flagellar motor protein [Gloeobacterales cyanobacterium ES-bin-141]
MPRRRDAAPTELNVWPAFADLMSNLFLITSLLLLVFIAPYLTGGGEDESPKDPPPIIVIQDTGGFRFPSGSARLPPSLSSYIRASLVVQVERNARDYRIDLVEVIGHTDTQPLGFEAASNLDLTLGRIAANQLPITGARPGSNADLGLLRALAVVQELRRIQKSTGRMGGLAFHAYSAAQLVPPNGSFSNLTEGADASRRRIEVRFTRSGPVTNAS